MQSVKSNLIITMYAHNSKLKIIKFYLVAQNVVIRQVSSLNCKFKLRYTSSNNVNPGEDQ